MQTILPALGVSLIAAVLALPATVAGQTITAAEYFLNLDPGPGNGTAIAVATPAPVVDLTVTVPANVLAALPDGTHRLATRVLDANGRWSLAATRFFHKSPPPVEGVPRASRIDYRWYQNGLPVSQVYSLTAATPANPILFEELAPMDGFVEGQTYQLVFTPYDETGRRGISVTHEVLYQPVSIFPPTLSDPVATGITATSATLGGSVTGDGGATITERGVVYSVSGTNNDPLIGGGGVTKVTAAGTTGVFTANASGLVNGTGYSFKAYAINSEGTSYTSVATFTTLSTNADLDALTLSSGTLDPAFASGTINYTASVTNATTVITVTPTRAQANAMIHARINGGSYAAVNSGSPSGSLALNVGSNTVDVRVTAQDGTTQKTYTITVTHDKATQTITFDTITDKTAIQSIPLSATSDGSTNPVTFSATGPAEIDVNNLLTFTGAGSVTVTARQAGNAEYHAATPVSHTFMVSKATATITLTGLSQAPDGLPRLVTAVTSPLGLNVSVTYNGGSTPPTGVGNYVVVATVDHPLYQGSATGVLVVDHRADREVEDPLEEAPLPDATNLNWEDSAASIYDGLLRDNSNGETVIGAIGGMLVTAPRAGSGIGGSFSTSIRLNGRSAPVRGAFNAQGRFTANVPQRDGSIVAVNLQLMKTTAGHHTIRGTVAWNGATARADLPRSPYSKANPLTGASLGTHTMVLPSEAGWGTAEPGGDGWATATVSAAGVVTVKGVLGDGTGFSETAYLSAEGEASLYVEPYASLPIAGRFGGKVRFRDQPGISDFDGVMQWRKFPDPNQLRYKNGFDIEVWALGSKYTPPVVGRRVLTQLANQSQNAELSLIGPTAPGGGGALDRVVTWTAANTLVYPGPETITGTVVAKTGLLSKGSYYDPVSRLKVPFTGVAFQKQGLAAGVFVNGASSGAVRLVPGIEFD